MNLRMSSVAIVILFLCVLPQSSCDKNVDDVQTKVKMPADLNVADESTHTNSDVLTKLEKPKIEQPMKPEALTTRPETELTIEKLFMEGIQAYTKHEWYLCVDKLETAIKDYRLFKQVMSDCRLDCGRGVRVSKLSIVSSSVHDLSHFAQLLRDADCFRRCKDESGITASKLTYSLENAFEKRVPYQYLQYCYFKLDRLKAAASAAYTYLLANPTDVDTKQNIVFYRDQAKVASADFLDLELVPYKDHYIRGLTAYSVQDWGAVITELEKSLEEYFHEHERCLVDCGARVMIKGEDLSTEVADMFINNLFCQLNCEEKLSIIHAEPVSHFLQNILHYLQVAYYQDGKVDKSVESVASFLVLNSSHVIIKENKDVLKTKHAYTDADFKPRQDVLEYAALRRKLEVLMDYLNKNYRWPFENNEPSSVLVNNQPEVIDKSTQEPEDDWLTKYEKLGVHVIAMSVDLHREGRFVVDNLLKEEECEELLALTQGVKAEKDHLQKFDLTLAQQRLKENLDEEYESLVRQFLRAAEKVGQYTRRLLGEEEQVYLQEAATVCRTPSDDVGQTDGCFAQEDGSCVRLGDMSEQLSAEAYITVTYLRTADGDFQFLDQFGQADSSFGVKCGRTVIYRAGDRHTVKLSRRGGDPRCAMVLGFSTVRRRSGNDYQDTLALLYKMGELRHASQIKSGRNVLKEFEGKGVRIVKNSEELMGKERFVADSLASDAQCTTLINMVQVAFLKI